MFKHLKKLSETSMKACSKRTISEIVLQKNDFEIVFLKNDFRIVFEK